MRNSDWFSSLSPRVEADKSISLLALRVFIALGRYLDDKAQCYAPQKGIAKSMGISRQRVQVGLRELEDLGYVVILGRKHRKCLYQVLDVDPAKPRTKRQRNKGRKCNPWGGTSNATPGVAKQNEKNLPPGLHDPATPGVAQTSREPVIPPYPPCEGGSAARPDGRTPVDAGGSPDGDHDEAATRPSDATKKQKGSRKGEHVSKSERPTATKCPPKGHSGALVARAANRLRGRRGKRPAPQNGFQRVLVEDLDEFERPAFTALAMEKGEEAALAAYGYDQQGRKKENHP